MAGYYRKYAQQKANQWWGANPLFLDTETTGLGPDAEIIEICIIDNDGEILLDTLIHPSRKIPLDATRIHGITDEQVDKAPSWLYLWPRLKEIITGRIIGIYNADFDLKFLRRDAKKIKREINNEIIDAYKLSKMAFPKLRNYKLTSVAEHLDIDTQNAHRALDDCKLTIQVFSVAAYKIKNYS